MVMGGAVGETPEGALFIFKDSTPEVRDPHTSAAGLWQLQPSSLSHGLVSWSWCYGQHRGGRQAAQVGLWSGLGSLPRWQNRD